MEWEDTQTTGGTTRRGVLKALGASATAGATGLAGCITDGGSTTPTPQEPPTFLLSTAQSGPYARVGENELNGFELAVRHINQGGGLVDAGAFDDLDGDGVLGFEVDGVTLDSEGSGEASRSNVLPYANDDATAMICGGVKASVARAHSELAAENDLTFMAGTTLLDEFAGEQCSSTTYRELYSSSALMEGLGPVLADEVGESVSYYQLYTDAPEGEDLKSAVNGYFSGADSPDWRPRGNEAIQPGSTNFEEDFKQATSGRPGAVFLNMFGIDVINALSVAVDVVPEETQIVIPYIDDSLGYLSGSDVAGVIGTTPWDPEIESEYTDPYHRAYVTRYGMSAGGQAQTGSATAHLTYVQTLQFAAAAERAGSFDPVAIRAELEGTEYDVGLGSQELQSCNHQATRPVPVVRGTSSRSSRTFFDLLDVADDAVRGCDESPATSCSM